MLNNITESLKEEVDNNINAILTACDLDAESKLYYIDDNLSQIKNDMKEYIEIHTVSSPTFLDNVYNYLADSINGTIDGVKGALGDSMDWIIDAIGEATKGIVDPIKKVFEDVYDSISNGIDAFKTVLNTVVQSLKTVVSNTIEAFKEQLTVLYNNIGSMIQGILDALIEGLDFLVIALSSGFEALTKNMQELFSFTIEDIIDFQTNLSEGIKKTVGV